MNSRERAPLKLLIRGFGVQVPGGAPVNALATARCATQAQHQHGSEQQRQSSAIPPLAVVAGSLFLVAVMPEHPGHALSGFPGDLRGDVALGLHGQCDRAVAEDFHDHPGRHTLGK